MEPIWIITKDTRWVDGTRDVDTVGITYDGDRAKSAAERQQKAWDKQNPGAVDRVTFAVIGPFTKEID